MRLMPAALLACLALAGCAGDSGDSGSDGGSDGTSTGAHGEHGASDPATHILAPTWQVGQYWTLSSEQAAASFTHVVSADAGNDWVMDTDSPDIAFFDARFDISFLGKVRKADLAGSQGNDRVEFFQFPLTQGKGWTTKWDGAMVRLNVTKVMDGKATIEARHENGTLYADYVYDSKTGYFQQYAFYAPDGATVGFAAKATASGQKFGGDLTRWALDTKFDVHGTIPGAQSTTFSIDSGVTDVWIDGHIACAAGAYSVAVGPPTGPAEDRGFSEAGGCPATVDATYSVPGPTADSEMWGAAIAGVPPQSVSLDLTVIARTQTLFKAGAAPA